MPELEDQELLVEFARSESESAFATLVARHVNLVYSAALRFTGNPHHAQEITQAVFIILARKAKSLGGKSVLSGWLYQTARLTAANFVKSEARRQQREQKAYMQSALNEPDLSRRSGTEADATIWQQLAPLLDEAMGGLGETDRNAVVLRFFENKTIVEVATALNTTEAAAHKRTTRALEKLRNFFGKRGVTLSAMAIAGAVLANSVQAAPIGLATSAAAAAKGSAVTASTFALVKGALKVMTWTKTKTAIATAVGILFVAATATLILSSRPSNSIAGVHVVANDSARPIDMTTNYTTPADYFDKITQFPAWKTVPRGFHVFDNVPLQIGGMICLWGEGNATKFNLNFPKQILGIHVGQKLQTLYVYHGSFFKSPDGTPVCKIVFRYEDGSSATNRLLYGDDVLDWVALDNTTSGPSAPNSKLAWIGGSSSPKAKHPLRFCLTAIENPQPGIAVTSIDLFSSESQTAACIMAMTAGDAELMKGSTFTDERKN